MKRVLIVFPTAWDRRQLAACREAWEGRYEVLFAEPADEDCPWDFDVLGFVERMVETWRGRIDGVMSSSDYPGATVAGAIATRLGLPGTPPESVIRCSHKYYSRVAQREAAPDATPEFHLVNPARADGDVPDLTFPCFIKPVKGAFSIMSRRLNSRGDLEEFLARPAVQEFAREYVHIFNALVARLTSFEVNGSWFLAESLLHGMQVTVEGYVQYGEVEILGVVDSALHPETKSFARFDYPSSLPREVQERMGEITRRVMARIGLESSLFNIEMIWEPANDTVHIIEVNPRPCGQFADLYHKVNGTSSYEVALALATGAQSPAPRRAGSSALAASFPLRVFRPVQVVSAPQPADLAAAEALYPGTLVWPECAGGQRLADFERAEDGVSARYAIVNLGADSRRELLERRARVLERLAFRFEPLATPG